MPNIAEKPIVVGPNAGTVDTLTALGRYLVAIVTSFPILLALLKTRDIAGILDYVRGSDGSVFVAAVIGIGTIVYGLFKTKKRGDQVATVASSPDVPARVAKIG